VRNLGHVTYIQIFGSLCISGMGKVSYFKFGTQIEHHVYKPKNAKVGQKGRGYVM